MVVFAAVSVVTLVLLPRLLRLAITYFGHRVSEPEIKLLLVVLFGLGGLATQAGSEAVLPAYVAGLVVAGVFLHDRVLMDRLRPIAFALLTLFFFLRAGTLISAPALVTGAGVIAVLLLVKLAAKVIGAWPVAAAFRLPARERTYRFQPGTRTSGIPPRRLHLGTSRSPRHPVRRTAFVFRRKGRRNVPIERSSLCCSSSRSCCSP